MLATSGEITEPCPVPTSLTVTTQDARLEPFLDRRMMRWSPIRCCRKRISHSWLITFNVDLYDMTSILLLEISHWANLVRRADIVHTARKGVMFIF
jgi:hypothetical protein